MRTIKYSRTNPSGDRIHHIDELDLEVVLSRLPEECYSRLKRIHLNDMARGNRILGYVTRAGKEISMCALPPRMSMYPFLVKGQKLEHYGAVKGAQWPKLAIRRFLLYDVFLHEIGHLQIVDPESRSPKKKFAREPKAQEFAMKWMRILLEEDFPHPDPVHNRPSKKELRDIKVFKLANKIQS